MIKFFPESALVQLEFEKVKDLLVEHCKTEYARTKAKELRIHTRKEYIEIELRQSHEYKLILEQGQYFPNDPVLNISRDIKLLSIPGAVLSSEQLMQIRRLADSMQQLFRWFNPEARTAYPALTRIISTTHYEKNILALIDAISG